MSPEQTRGRNIDRRSDFFSLGCLLYQCLTGVLPFKSENVLATLQSVQMLTPTAPMDLDPSVNSELSSLVMTLLEKSPVNRPDHANDIAAAFDLPVSDWNFAPAKDRQPALPINSDPKTGVATQPARWWPAIASLVALGFIMAGAYFAPQIIRIATNQGQIVIESNDPDVQIGVLQGGELIEIVDLKTKQKLNIVAGEYQIRPMGNENEISIDKQKVTISRGSETIVRVTREPVSASVTQSSAGNLSERASFVADTTRNKPATKKAEPYLLDTGDVLGVFIENILGEFGTAPPVQMPAPGSDLPPSLGFPIAVLEDGKISLPLIPRIELRGCTIQQAEELISRAYRGGENPILIKTGRIIVTLARKRGYKAPVSSIAMRQAESIAKTRAQLRAAEAGHGNDHPLVQRLRTDLDALLREGDLELVEPDSELPTYNGKTYAQCYKVVKYERNPELAWPSVRGLIELYDKETKEEAIQACLEFLRRTEFSRNRDNEFKFLTRVGTIVDADTLAGMLLSEVRSGTHLSQGAMVQLFTNHTTMLKRKAILKNRQEDFAKAIIKSANDNNLNAYYAALLLKVIHTDTGLEIGSFEGVNKTLVAAISDQEVANRPSSDVIEFAMNTLSNSPEIAAAVFRLVLKPMHNHTSLSRFIYYKLTKLSPDQLKLCVPMIQEHEVYMAFKRQLKNMPERERVDISDSQERVFRLIAAFGEHAKTKALVSDFEKFEALGFINDAYVRARKAVLGK